MITENGNFCVGRCPSELYGLSTDTKPTDVYNASVFYEMDTGALYLFDEQNKRWLIQGGAG